MKRIFSPIFQSVVKRKEMLLYLSFILLPIPLAFITSGDLIDQLKVESGQISLLSYIAQMIATQTQICIPFLIFGFVITSVFRDDFDSGRMFLYKDIKRSHVFVAKVISLLLAYLSFVLGTVIVSAICYYTFVPSLFKVSGNILPMTSEALLAQSMYLFSMIALNVIIIMLTASLSLKFKSGVAVLVGTFVAMFALVVPNFKMMRYVSPNSYTYMLKEMPYMQAFGIMLVLTLVYFGICYVTAFRNFVKKEF